jgi:hypothetical protein
MIGRQWHRVEQDDSLAGADGVSRAEDATVTVTQHNSRLGATRSFRGTKDTFIPGYRLGSTGRCFTAAEYR